MGALLQDPERRATFTKQLEARSVEAAFIERLVRFARERQTTSEHAMARRVLTDAGISWESL